MKTGFSWLLTVILMWIYTSAVTAQAMPTKFKNVTVYGVLYKENQNGVLSYLIGKAPDTYRISPETLYPHLQTFAGKRIIISGRGAITPGRINTLKVSSLNAVKLQTAVEIRGMVLEARIKTKTIILIKTKKRVFSFEDPLLQIKAAKFINQEIVLTGYLNSDWRTAKKIAEVISIKPAPAESFRYPCEGYLKRTDIQAESPLPDSDPQDKRFILLDILKPGNNITVTAFGSGTVMYADTIHLLNEETNEPAENGVLIIEHKAKGDDNKLHTFCSVYTGLAAFGKGTETGKKVLIGDTVGTVEKTGTFSFGIHYGPYYQLSPAHKQELLSLVTPVTLEKIQRKPLDIVKTGDSEAEIRYSNGSATKVSLLVEQKEGEKGKKKPDPVMGWFTVSGGNLHLKEWIKPSVVMKHFVPVD